MHKQCTKYHHICLPYSCSFVQIGMVKAASTF